MLNILKHLKLLRFRINNCLEISPDVMVLYLGY